jgi:hypothetical protein
VSNPAQTKFDPGVVTATPAAIDTIRVAGQTVHAFVARHLSGDWGDLDAEDRRLNDEALADGSRLFSAYTLRSGDRIWVITEAADDAGYRAATTVLLPDEY